MSELENLGQKKELLAVASERGLVFLGSRPPGYAVHYLLLGEEVYVPTVHLRAFLELAQQMHPSLYAYLLGLLGRIEDIQEQLTLGERVGFMHWHDPAEIRTECRGEYRALGEWLEQH